MVIIQNITEDKPSVPPAPPSRIEQSDKKDYNVNLVKSPGDRLDNIEGLRLYLGCYRMSNDDAMSNCKLSVIGNPKHTYSTIEPINPESNDKTDVLRYVLTDNDVRGIINNDEDGINIKVKLETSQNDAEDRTEILPITTPEEYYTLKAHIEYTRTSVLASKRDINIKVF